MSHSLKHYAFRTWSAAVAGGLAALWLLPTLEPLTWPGGALLPAGALMLLGFMASGWLADGIARALLGPRMREAGIWERSGMHAEAETAFRRALSLSASFLMLPRSHRQIGAELTARMARFYLAHPDPGPHAEAFVRGYLRRHSADRQVVRGWLSWLEGRTAWDPAIEELATRLGQEHGDDADIQRRLAGVFLRARRRDFTAIQAYRDTLARAGETAEGVERLADSFLEEGRADVLALETYLQAVQQGADPRKFHGGLAACLRWVPETAATAPLLTHARELLGQPNESALRRLSTGFVPPDLPRVPPAPAAPIHRRAPPGRSLIQGLAAWQSALTARVLHARARMHLASRSMLLRRTLKWALPGALALTAALLLVNTARHLAPAPDPPPAPATARQEPAAPEIQALFTLQVAAYRQPEHAERYVRQLRQQELDAYIARVSSGEKTWYQVRLSQFQDKETARAYGMELKQRGVIQDFYVANNTRLERPSR
jgi:hypothetical protein